MPSLNNVVLAVTTVEPGDQITVTVEWNVAFSESDAHAMRELGQKYTLRCEVLRKELLEEIPVLAFGNRSFPPFTREVHVEFQLTVPMNALHGRLVGQDELTARVTLVDRDTDWQIVQDSERVSLDLAA